MESRLSLNNLQKQGISKRERFGSFQSQVCLTFSKLTSDLSEYGSFARQKHLLFRSVTLSTVANKSGSIMLFQGIACFFLPSQLSFSKAQLSMFEIPQY